METNKTNFGTAESIFTGLTPENRGNGEAIDRR